jgi:hypothetical protein
MKQLKETIASAAAGADTRNAEGAPAWSMRDGERLVQLAMTGTLGPAFYASAQEVTAEAAALLERAGAAPLAEAIVRGRNEGFVRTFPLLGLAYLSKKDPALFRETFPKVVLTGGDLGDFLDLAHKLRGFGRSVKAAVRAWLEAKTTPYYAQKYRKQLADAARISRFRGEDPIWAWILAAREGTKGVTEERVAAVRGPQIPAEVPLPDEVAALVEAYWQARKAGKLGEAWLLMSPRFRESQPPEEYAQRSAAVEAETGLPVAWKVLHCKQLSPMLLGLGYGVTTTKGEFQTLMIAVKDGERWVLEDVQWRKAEGTASPAAVPAARPFSTDFTPGGLKTDLRTPLGK